MLTTFIILNKLGWNCISGNSVSTTFLFWSIHIVLYSTYLEYRSPYCKVLNCIISGLQNVSGSDIYAMRYVAARSATSTSWCQVPRYNAKTLFLKTSRSVPNETILVQVVARERRFNIVNLDNSMTTNFNFTMVKTFQWKHLQNRFKGEAFCRLLKYI